MARYAEWNKFIGNLKTDQYGETNVNEVGIAFEKSTAEVAPRAEVERLERILNSYALQYGTVRDKQKVIDEAKSEVAREIFEEIDKILDNYSIILDGEIGFFSLIAELKKKYTEGE